MRITQKEASQIKEAAEAFFGIDCSVRLFGSRADDSRRGGDIDIFVDTQMCAARSKKRDFVLELWERIGVQKIDVVIHQAGEPLLPIHLDALDKGIEL